MRKTLILVVVMALTLGLMAGCGKETESRQAGRMEAESEKKGVIGLSVLTMTNPFFKTIADSMQDEAAKYGYEVVVTSAEMDPAQQRLQVEDFITQNVSAIVLTPVDSRAVGTAIRSANSAGIPVFTADIACMAENAKVVSHVATNNYKGGRLAAQAMMEALGDTGKVAIIHHPEVESTIRRVRGFKDELKEADSDIEIVGVWPGQGARDESYKAAMDILTRYGDLDGIFAINDPSALGACAALEKKGRSEDVVVVGFDGQPEGKLAIKEGRIYADPVQFPGRIGRKTVGAIMDYFAGKEVPPRILITPELYYQEDAANDPELQES